MDVGMVEMLSVLKKLDDITYEASSGEALDDELTKITRWAEMETFKKRRVYKKVPLEARWRVTGKHPFQSSGWMWARETRSTRSSDQG